MGSQKSHGIEGTKSSLKKNGGEEDFQGKIDGGVLRFRISGTEFW